MYTCAICGQYITINKINTSGSLWELVIFGLAPKSPHHSLSRRVPSNLRSQTCPLPYPHIRPGSDHPHCAPRLSQPPRKSIFRINDLLQFAYQSRSSQSSTFRSALSRIKEKTSGYVYYFDYKDPEARSEYASVPILATPTLPLASTWDNGLPSCKSFERSRIRFR